MRTRKIPRTRQARGARIVRSHVYPGIKEVWSATSPWLTLGLRTRTPTHAGVTFVPSAVGVVASLATGSGNGIALTSNPDTLFPTGAAACTILVLRRSRDTTARSTMLFGYDNGAADRVQLHAPLNDGNLYWDYGNATAGSGRVSVAFTKATAWEVLVLSAGPARGREVWRNGVRIASNTAATGTRTSNTTSGFRIGGIGPTPTNGQADNDDVALFIVAHAEWTPEAIRAASRRPTISPFRIFAPLVKRLPSRTAGGFQAAWASGSNSVIQRAL